MAELNWSDAQWQKVKDCVTEAFNKASVASAFFRLYGPLSGGTETVRNERLRREDAAPLQGAPMTVRLDGDHDAANLRLVNLTVNVELTSEQVADETLSNAMLAFQNASNILALEEDRVVFAGYKRGFANENSDAVVNRVDPQRGLADLPTRQNFADLIWRDPEPITALGQLVVTAVVTAMNTVEANRHPAPFACVLGTRLFEAVHAPTDAMVLPADRVTPLLKGGPLLRSGQINRETGIVVSLASNAIDIVVGTPPTVQLLQRQPNGRYLFRVYERFVLRIRDEATPPVAGFRVRPDPGAFIAEIDRLAALIQP